MHFLSAVVLLRQEGFHHENMGTALLYVIHATVSIGTTNSNNFPEASSALYLLAAGLYMRQHPSIRIYLMHTSRAYAFVLD